MNTEPGKNKSALDQAKDRFRYGTVRPLTLICTLFVIICVGIMMINSVRDDTERLRVRVTDLSISREEMARERDKLQSEVSTAAIRLHDAGRNALCHQESRGPVRRTND